MTPLAIFELRPEEHPIAIVVRDHNVALLCEKVLRKVGYPVVQCRADDARLVETIQAYRPHLLLVDDDIEWSEGIHIALRLHADPITATLPMLMLMRRCNERPACMENDPYSGKTYLTRPFAPAELVSFVRRILQAVLDGDLPPFPQTNYSQDYWQAWRKKLPSFALFDAIRDGDQNRVERLLAQGVDIQAKDAKGWTALHFAAHYTDHYRVYAENPSIVRLLLEKGADVNAEAKLSKTPLIIAASQAQLPVMRMLLEHGADPNVYARDEGTALLSLLKYKRREESTPRLEAAVTLLLESGADPNRKYQVRETALQRARMHGLPTIEQILLRFGAQDS